MEYNVVITKNAEQDMENIYNHIALELLSPEYAMGQYNRITGNQVEVTNVLYTPSDVERRLK